jgi:hypothetical protein
MAALKSFEVTRRHLGALNRLPPQAQAIDVRRIVGSVDGVKAQTLRADFLPRAGRTRAPRYRSVLAAMCQERPLPAIEVYGLGGEYYVLDGHHRVAAARALGGIYLDAVVHEFPVPGGGAGAGADRAGADLPPAPPAAGGGRRYLTRGLERLRAWWRPEPRACPDWLGQVCPTTAQATRR